MDEPVQRAWTAQEDIELLTAIEKGCSIADIASQLGRTVADCRARLDEVTESHDSIFPRETAAT